MDKRTAVDAATDSNGKHVRPKHARHDVRLTRAAVMLEQLLERGGKIADRIKAEWPDWELWRFRRGIRRPGVEGTVTMQKITRGKIRPEHWTKFVKDAS